MRPWIAALLPLALLSLGASSAHAQARATSGTTRLFIDPGIAADLGLEVLDSPVVGSGAEFALAAGSSLVLDAAGRDFEGFAAGALQHRGSFTLRAGGASHVLTGFRLVPGDSPLELELRDASGARWFVLASMHAELRARVLRVRNADLLIAPELAALLRRRDLAWTYAGRAEASWRVFVPSPGPLPQGGDPCAADFESPVDVAVVSLTSLTQSAREPGGRVAMAPAVTLKSVGPGSVEWNRAIAPDAPVGPHPFLVLHLYALQDDALEQIGRSDLKHAFFTGNTACPCPGGHILYTDCEDVYGVNTNVDPYYLAPRDELVAATGDWQSLGSHFDALPEDDRRHHFGAGDHDSFEHRLVVLEADLERPGARYFIEGWYVVAGDVNLLNSLGHREVVPSLVGDTWGLPFADAALVPGSILDLVVDPASPQPGQATELLDTGLGRLQLAVSALDRGGGTIHYEYALMNFDFDPGLRSFSIPSSPASSVANVEYRDGDADSSNDWIASVGADSISWRAPPGAELRWGTLVGFAFDSDTAPVATTAQLDVFDPGTPAVLAIRTLGPTPAAIPLGPPVVLIALGLLATALALRYRARPR